MKQLQVFLDVNRIDAKQPIDLTSFCNTGLYMLEPGSNHFGVQLTDEGANEFKAKINIEVQHASELVIATIERQGGVIRTAYYDTHSLYLVRNPNKWFEKGVPIPRRMLPPQDAVDYYTDPKNRGYLADPEAISHERMVRLFASITFKHTIEFKPIVLWYRFWHKNMVMSYRKSKTIQTTNYFRKLKIHGKYFMAYILDG